QRRKIVTALVNAARKLVIAEDPQMTGAKLPLSEVEATLTAALAEPEIAAQVRTGRLIRAATYAGFGEVPRPRLRLVSDADADADADTDEDEDEGDEAEVVEFPQQSSRERQAAERRRREWEQRRRELRRELGSAQAAERRADEQLERAESAERDAGHRVEDLDAELAELERRRTEAQADVARRKQARRTAEREAVAARRQVGDVQAAANAMTGLATIVGAFAESPQTLRRARLLGLSGWAYHVSARAGALGDVRPETVAAAIGFIAPEAVTDGWEAAAKTTEPMEVATWHLHELCRWGGDQLGGFPRLSRLL